MAKRRLNKGAIRACGDVADRPVDDQFQLAINLADAASDAVLLCDGEGRLRYANSACGLW